MKFDLTIIIVSFNTSELLKNCLISLTKASGKDQYRVIVVDNGSYDDSVKVAKKYIMGNLEGEVIETGKNLGFSKGNNKARSKTDTKYVLFLNSDTEVNEDTISECINYMEKHKDVGATTCKILLPNGKLDKDTRRTFPTPWVSITHLVFKLDRLFPKSELFSKYWYGYKSENEIHEVDVIQGAFLLTKKDILDKVGWFDEDYFLDGEDIDLCWKIKSDGWKIMYYPKVTIKHIKKASKKKPQNKSERKKFVSSGVESMELFYRKRLWDKYPLVLNVIIIICVRIVKYLRLAKLYLS
jgi:GT2 family glycosyltransferase